MQREPAEHKKCRRIASYMLVVLIFLILLTTATYTWFSLSKTPAVNDLAMYVNAPAGLELAERYDSEDWTRQLAFDKLVTEETPLKPATYSRRNGSFMAINYGLDGRMKDTFRTLRDEYNANTKGPEGYYVKGTFYVRCGQAATVSLSPAVELEEGRMGSGTYLISTPVWNSQTLTHQSGGNGAQYAVRVGMRIRKTDLNGQILEGSPERFYIYEPNCDRHIDGTAGYVPTPSIDGTETLVPEADLILQTESTWTEANPVERTVVIRSMGQFTRKPELFRIEPGELVMIDLYIWLEGQDIDCTNEIGHEAKILASIQFDSDLQTGTGLETIQ